MWMGNGDIECYKSNIVYVCFLRKRKDKVVWRDKGGERERDKARWEIQDGLSV